MQVQTAFRVAAAVLVVFSLPAVARAGGSVSAVAPVSVNIVAPVTLQATQGLNFGAVTKPGAGGANTVTLDAGGNVSVTGAGDATHPAGAASAAKFNLVGQAGITYSTTQSLAFEQAGLTNVAVGSPVAGNGVLGVIPASGTQELRFGGAFDLSAATPIGAYTGSLTVTVNYN